MTIEILFGNVQLLVLGTLQLIAKAYPARVRDRAACWLRSVTATTPSEVVTRIARSRVINSRLSGFAKDWITRLIQAKKDRPEIRGFTPPPLEMSELMTVEMQVVTSAMAAYAFSRLRWWRRDVVFLDRLATVVIPAVILPIPSNCSMFRIGLLDSCLGLILPAACNGFGAFLLWQFAINIPTHRYESAEIDGSSRCHSFSK